MTAREFVMKSVPGAVDSGSAGGMFGCPNEHLYDAISFCHGEVDNMNNETCTKCWDQDIHPGNIEEPKKRKLPKGFIEIHSEQESVLVNTHWIEEVRDKEVYLCFTSPNAYEQDYIVCEEMYEELVQKIAEATK